MKKLTCLSLLVAAWALVCGDAHGETLSFNVPAGETNAYTSAIGSDVTAITKAGGGRLHLAQGTTQNAFAGTISIDEGTLGADTPPNFGKPTSVTVANGATLDLSAIAGNGSAGYVQNLTIAGYGYGNAGAFRRASGNAQDYLLKNLTLSGDAMFYNSVRCGASSGTIDLGGHTLEKRGGGEFLFNGAAVRNMGRLIVNGGTLTIQGAGCRFDGDESANAYDKRSDEDKADEQKVLKNLGAYRAPRSTYHFNSSGTKYYFVGTNGVYRRILCQTYIDKDTDHYLRFRVASNGKQGNNNEFMLDYLEIVPKSVYSVDGDGEMEDDL